MSTWAALLGAELHASVSLVAPLGSEQGEIDWILDGPWAKLALLMTLAIVMLTVSGLLMKRRTGGGGGARVRGDFDLAVAKMENLEPTPIAQAQAGPTRLMATLASSNGSMGGAPGRECVWRNRYGGARSTAVAAELVIAQDDSGQVGIEDLEGARVLAPKDEGTGKHEFASLLLGDEVELLGYFKPEVWGDANAQVYGMMGVDSQVQVRLVNRPPPATTSISTHASPKTDEASDKLPAQTSDTTDAGEPS